MSLGKGAKAKRATAESLRRNAEQNGGNDKEADLREARDLEQHMRSFLRATKPNILHILDLIAREHFNEIVTKFHSEVKKDGEKWWVDSYSMIAISTDLKGWHQNPIVSCNETLSRLANRQRHCYRFLELRQMSKWRLDTGRVYLLLKVLTPKHLNMIPAAALKHGDAVLESSFTATGQVVPSAKTF